MGVFSSFAYWYHSVKGISLGLAQSDPIKWHQILGVDQEHIRAAEFKQFATVKQSALFF